MIYNCLALQLLHKVTAKPKPIRGVILFVNPNPKRTSYRAQLVRVK